MPENALHPVSSGAAHTVKANAVPIGAAGGKVRPDAGNISPLQAASVGALNLNEVVEELNIRSRSVGRALRFHVDAQSGKSVIQVIDRDTGELIRQIPPAEVSALTSPGGVDIQLIDKLV